MQHKHTKDRILRYTCKMGPFDNENRRTKPRHQRAQDRGPPGSIQDKRLRERWHPGVGRTQGSPEPRLAPVQVRFGRWFSLILLKAVPSVSIFNSGRNRPPRAIKRAFTHPLKDPFILISYTRRKSSSSAPLVSLE